MKLSVLKYAAVFTIPAVVALSFAAEGAWTGLQSHTDSVCCLP